MFILDERYQVRIINVYRGELEMRPPGAPTQKAASPRATLPSFAAFDIETAVP
jgi:hypothetical protein